MSNDRDRYAYAANRCLSKAEAALKVGGPLGPEIQAMWRSVASGYVFLSRRAERLEGEEQERAQNRANGTGNIS